MTGPRDMPPWEARLYSAYRGNLHRTHNTPPRPTKERNLHRLERALLIWPIHAYVWWAQRRTRYKPITTETVETPTGVFFNAPKEDA